MLKLELKRIFSKKINVFAIGLALILAVIFSGFAVTSNRYVDENGNASTGIMATRKLTDNRRAWKGTLTEDELGKVIEQNKNAVTQSSKENAIYGTWLSGRDSSSASIEFPISFWVNNCRWFSNTERFSCSFFTVKSETILGSHCIKVNTCGFTG